MALHADLVTTDVDGMAEAENDERCRAFENWMVDGEMRQQSPMRFSCIARPRIAP
jgi:hypothetical protein